MSNLYSILFFILFSGISVSSFSQDSISDQLLNEIQSANEESTKIDLFIKLSTFFSQTNMDSSLYYGKEAEKLSLELSDPYFLAKATSNLGSVHIRRSSFENALISYSKSLDYLEKIPEEHSLKASVLRGIGNVYFIQYKYDEALSFFDDSQEYFRKAADSLGLARVYGGYANVYYETERPLLALKYYKKQLAIFISTNSDEMDLGSSYLNMGMLYESIDSLNQSVLYSEKALEISRRNNALVMMTYPLKVLSTVSRRLEDYEQARSYAQQSLDLANQLGILYEEKDAHLNLSEAYKGLNNFENALFHYRTHKELNDSLLNEDANTRLAEMRAKYESEKKEQEIFVLETENRLQQARIISITSVFAIIIVLSGSGILWFAARKRKELDLLEKDKIIAQSNKKLAVEELQTSKLREENLQTELTNYALHIVEKNDFLEEIKTEMAEIKSEVKNTDALLQINKLGSKIYQNLMLNKDREEFENQVDQACSGFYRNLERNFPTLTYQERRLAALLRLNLTSKEISGILNISPKSVDQSRYRLRKKLPLKNSRNLSVFLNQI